MSLSVIKSLIQTKSMWELSCTRNIYKYGLHNPIKSILLSKVLYIAKIFFYFIEKLHEDILQNSLEFVYMFKLEKNYKYASQYPQLSTFHQ